MRLWGAATETGLLAYVQQLLHNSIISSSDFHLGKRKTGPESQRRSLVIIFCLSSWPTIVSYERRRYRTRALLTPPSHCGQFGCVWQNTIDKFWVKDWWRYDIICRCDADLLISVGETNNAVWATSVGITTWSSHFPSRTSSIQLIHCCMQEYTHLTCNTRIALDTAELAPEFKSH